MKREQGERNRMHSRWLKGEEYVQRKAPLLVGSLWGEGQVGFWNEPATGTVQQPKVLKCSCGHWRVGRWGVAERKGRPLCHV